MILLSGKLLADKILKDLTKEILELKAHYIVPKLAIILVGHDRASELYTSIKQKKASDIGIETKLFRLPAKIIEKAVLDLIYKLNNDKKITGILVQMPLPQHIATQKIVWAIAPEKDVDGFQIRKFLPPAPSAVLDLLQYYGISIVKKKFLIIGKGFLVGRPLAILATRRGARVITADENTNHLSRLCQDAQIIVTATGQPNLLGPEMLGINQIIIDAGGGWDNGEFVSEIKLIGATKKPAAITPNPGGIGPLTVAKLLENVVKAARMTKVKQF